MAANTAMTVGAMLGGYVLRPFVEQYLPLSKFTTEDLLSTFSLRYHGATHAPGDLPLRIEYRPTRCYQQLSVPSVSQGAAPRLLPTPTVQHGDTESGIPWIFLTWLFILFMLALALGMYKFWSLATAHDAASTQAADEEADEAAPKDNDAEEADVPDPDPRDIEIARLENELSTARGLAKHAVMELSQEKSEKQEAYVMIAILAALLSYWQRSARNAAFICGRKRIARVRDQQTSGQRIADLEDELDETELELDSTKVERDALRDELEQMSVELDSTKIERDDLRDELEQMTIQLDSTIIERDGLGVKLEVMTLSAGSAGIALKMERIDGVKREGRARARIAALNSELARKDTSLNDTKAKLHNTTVELNRFRALFYQMQVQLLQAHAQLIQARKLMPQLLQDQTKNAELRHAHERIELLEQQLDWMINGLLATLGLKSEDTMKAFVNEVTSEAVRWQCEAEALEARLKNCICGAASGKSGRDDQDDDDDENGPDSPDSDPGAGDDDATEADDTASPDSDDQAQGNDKSNQDQPTDTTEGDPPSPPAPTPDQPIDHAEGDLWMQGRGGEDATPKPQVHLPGQRLFKKPEGWEKLSGTHQRKYERKWRNQYRENGGDAQAAYDYCNAIIPIPHENQAW